MSGDSLIIESHLIEHVLLLLDPKSVGGWGRSIAFLVPTTLVTITYKSRLTPKKLYKKTKLFLASMGEMGLSHDILLKFSLWPYEVVEVK